MAASQRVVAGVSIDECLTTGAYGAVHKAHTASRRDLRALLVDRRLAADAAFAAALLDDRVKGLLTSFDHPSIVPTLSIARAGEELVVVTVGPGRHTTVAELLAAGRKLPVEVAGAIAQAVIQALAAAHQRGLVHGAVHPRSVAIDETGHVRLCDFAAGRALTEAVARGADPSLLRGLTGALPPEVALGDPPSSAGDVFAAGALLFTMLTGEPPPGPLRVTPAVERVVQLALDTDPVRRYRSGSELLESLLEAFDDDRWTIADAAELRKLVLGRAPAVAAAAEGNLDDDTEDLLASLGSTAKNVALTRPSIDIRAAAVAERQKGGTGKIGLDELLADLDPKEELTAVDEPRPRRDPISEIIRMDERRPAPRPAAVPGSVPDFEADRDNTPLPAPAVTEDSGLLLPAGKGKPRAAAPTVPAKPRGGAPAATSAAPAAPATPAAARPRRDDEIAALSAIADLDDRPATDPPGRGTGSVPARPAPSAAAPAPAKLPPGKQAAVATSLVRRRPVSAVEPHLDDAPAIRLKSRFWPIVWVAIIVVGGAAAVYYYLDHAKQMSAAAEEKDRKEKEAARKEAEAREEQDDPGNIVIESEPAEGSAYLLLGRTPLDYPVNGTSVTFGLPTDRLIELRVELDKYVPVDVQIPGNLWSLDNGPDKLRVAKLVIPPLRVAEYDRKGNPKVVLDQQPPKPPDAILNGPFPPGRGTIHVETTPPNAAVWLFIGTTNNVRFENLVAGKDYEFRVLKNGYLPGYIKVNAEEWRAGGDPHLSLSAAPKHETLTKQVVLTPDPNAAKPK